MPADLPRILAGFASSSMFHGGFSGRAIACRENCHFHSTGTRSTVNASRRVTSCRQWQPLRHCGALSVALSRPSRTIMKELPLLSFPRFLERAYARPRSWITPSLPPCHDLIMAAGAAASRRGGASARSWTICSLFPCHDRGDPTTCSANKGPRPISAELLKQFQFRDGPRGVQTPRDFVMVCWSACIV